MGDPMTKINGHEVQYFVNEEKRTVTAKIFNTRVDAWERFTEISHLDYCWNVSKKTLFSFDMQPEMSCTAKCHTDDEFDVEIGKIIAYKKLQKKYWLKYSQAMNRIYFYLSNKVTDAIDAEWCTAYNRSANIDPFSILNKKQ